MAAPLAQVPSYTLNTRPLFQPVIFAADARDLRNFCKAQVLAAPLNQPSHIEETVL